MVLVSDDRDSTFGFIVPASSCISISLFCIISIHSPATSARRYPAGAAARSQPHQVRSSPQYAPAPKPRPAGSDPRGAGSREARHLSKRPSDWFVAPGAGSPKVAELVSWEINL